MYKNQSIAVIMPSHNEANHIGTTIQTLPDFVDHIIVVDDCSRDDTAGAARATGDARLSVLQPLNNLGVGGATVMGYRQAMEAGAQIAVKMDGDGQMMPEYLPALLDALIDEGYDYAKGNRFLAGESLAQMPKVRLFGNVALTFLTKMASGYWHVFDPQNGYTAIKTSALKRLELAKIHQRFFFENDMLSHLNYQNCRVKDVGIPARYGDEVSDLDPFKISLTFPSLLLKRFARRLYQKYILRDFSPIALFLLMGALLFGWGMVFGFYIWIKSLVTGQPTPTGTIMLALLPLILGFQLMLQGFVLDIQQTPK